MVGLTKTVAREWGAFNIRCNAIAYGFIATRLTASKDDGASISVNGEKVIHLMTCQQLDGGTDLVSESLPMSQQISGAGSFRRQCLTGFASYSWQPSMLLGGFPSWLSAILMDDDAARQQCKDEQFSFAGKAGNSRRGSHGSSRCRDVNPTEEDRHS